MCTMLGNIFCVRSATTRNLLKAYNLVRDMFSICKYQGPHSPVKLPPFNKHIQLFFNIHGSMWFHKMGGLMKDKEI